MRGIDDLLAEVMMVDSHLFEAVAGVAGSAVTILVVRLYQLVGALGNKTDRLNSTISDLQIKIAEGYVSKHQFKDFADANARHREENLKILFAKLDNLVSNVHRVELELTRSNLGQGKP